MLKIQFKKYEKLKQFKKRNDIQGQDDGRGNKKKKYHQEKDEQMVKKFVI